MAKLLTESSKEIRRVLHPHGYQVVHKGNNFHTDVHTYFHHNKGNLLLVHNNGSWVHMDQSGGPRIGIGHEELGRFLDNPHGL